ncbi:MAG: Nif3-like dinuclear metal center hexameric protein [Saprospiraceae bacterium]|nr:Nif3-like dinuclear metal center hexameric protein [Saprospiraceae bacterium]
MKIKEIISCIENFAPLSFQEDYDNSGLIIGDKNAEISKALITLDITEKVIDEAIDGNFQLIISHHPIVFAGLKKITGKNFVERIVIKAIKNNIAIYSAHTNLDNFHKGVNAIICQKIGLKNCKILSPKSDLLRKLVTFCPIDKAEEVRRAIFEAGAGHIGNYDSCSFNTEGKGSFKANEDANPYVGEQNKLHFEKEERIETIYSINNEAKILNALLKSHPYEEVAYDIYPLKNKFNNVGAGMIGELEIAEDEKDFLKRVKEIVGVGCVKHSDFIGKKIIKVAVCGGSGSFLINNAISSGADIFLTGDLKYHQFFDADEKMIIADIGHFESEQFTKELLLSILNENFPKFAVQISKCNTNAVNYL